MSVLTAPANDSRKENIGPVLISVLELKTIPDAASKRLANNIKNMKENTEFFIIFYLIQF